MSADVEPAWEVLPAEDLVGLINDGHESVKRTMGASILGAIQVGYWLSMLKDQKRRETMDADGHSSFRWLDFVEENLAFGRRQAANYMRVYRHREKIRTRVANFSGMKSALQFLDEEEREERRQAKGEAPASHNGEPGEAEEPDDEPAPEAPSKPRRPPMQWDQLLANTGAISAAIARHGLKSILRLWSAKQVERGILQCQTIAELMKTIEDALRRKLDEGH